MSEVHDPYTDTGTPDGVPASDDIHAELGTLLQHLCLLRNGNTDPGVQLGMRVAIELIEPLRDKYKPQEVAP